MTIDMKNFGSGPSAPAETEALNSYQQEVNPEEVHVQEQFLTPSEPVTPESQVPEAVEEPSQQELNFRALREEVDRIKAERDEFRQNLDLLRANVNQSQNPQPTQEKKFLDGLGDSEIPNVGELREAFERREMQYRAQLEELQVAQAHPDYAEVLEKYTAPLLKQKPYLAEGILNSSNKALMAYELGKMAQNNRPEPVASKPQNNNAQRIIENSKKPGNIAQTGGQSVLSKADYYATMSDQEFMTMASKNLGEI